MADADLYTNNLHPGGCDMIIFKEPLGTDVVIPHFSHNTTYDDLYSITLTGARAKEVLRSVYMKKEYAVTFSASISASLREAVTGTLSAAITGKFLHYGGDYNRYRGIYMSLEGSGDIPRKRVCGGVYRRTFLTDQLEESDTTDYTQRPHILPSVGVFARGAIFSYDPVDQNQTLTVLDPDDVEVGNVTEDIYGEDAIGSDAGISFHKIWVVGDGSIKVWFRADARIAPGDYGGEFSGDFYACNLSKVDASLGITPVSGDETTLVQGYPVTFTVLGQTVNAFINVLPDKGIVSDTDLPSYYRWVEFLSFSMSYDLAVTEFW